MKYYLLCLEDNYDVELGNNDVIAISTLEGIIDNLVDLMRSYGIDEQEILERFKEETDIYTREED
jgi:hypothetical protein